MPIALNWLEHLLFRSLNQAPAPLLDIWSAVAFRVVLAAVRLQVFDALRQGPCSASELAHQRQLDAHGTAILLGALETLGYVHKQDNRYTNTAMTTKWLAGGGTTDFSAYFRYWGTLLSERFADLEQSLRTGQPDGDLYTWLEGQPQAVADYQEGMIALAHFAADEIVNKLELPTNAQRLLDVGGGHGLYSVAFCRQHPALQATVFDSPQALKTAYASIVAAQMTDRITLQPGDLWRDDLGQGYDVALLFNIIHGFSPAQNAALFAKVAAALRPGGRIVLLDQLVDGTSQPLANAVSQLLDISYFHVLGGQLYPYEEIVTWLQAAGFIRMLRIRLLRVPGSSLIIGTKIG